MSDFIGADLYCIVSYSDPKFIIDLAGGSKADGTKAQIYNTGYGTKNAQWHFVHAGVGKTGKDEYLILNATSGTYLTVPDGSKIQDLVTCSTLAPTDSRVRWSVIPLRNGTGAYWIAPVADKKLSLNIKNGKKENHNPVQLYNGSAANKDVSSMWYLRLADAAVPNCPEVDKAPTNANSKM